MKLKLYKNPKSAKERQHNKDIRLLAEQIRSNEEKKLLMYGYGYLDSSRNKVNFFDYAIKIVERKGNSNQQVYLSALKSLVVFNGSDHLLFGEVNSLFLKKYRDFLLNHRSQNTAYSYFNKIGCILKEAIKDELIFNNPMEKVEKIKQVTSNKVALTFQELQQLKATDFNSSKLKKAFLFSCFTGLRVGDTFSVTWSNVSSDNVLSFYPQKTPDKLMKIKLHPTALEMMGKRGSDTQRIFPCSYSNVSKKLKVWMDEVGINKKITYHNSRHTFASLGLEFSGNIYAIKESMGHSNIKTTEVYLHLQKAQKEALINSIPQL
ncbi:tyrosine-type recombinase/integrase [Sediminitomix flava]|nr:site-specific integrase [Sediminitomix flava]